MGIHVIYMIYNQLKSSHKTTIPVASSNEESSSQKNKGIIASVLIYTCFSALFIIVT